MSRASWTGVADIAPVCLASQALSMRRRRPISGGAAQTPHLLQPVWTVRIVPLVSLSGVGCGPEASEARAKRTSGHLGSSAVAVLPSRDDKSCLPVVVASERAEVPDLRHSLIGIRKGRRWLSSPLTHSSSKLRFTTAVLRSDALPIERLTAAPIARIAESSSGSAGDPAVQPVLDSRHTSRTADDSPTAIVANLFRP